MTPEQEPLEGKLALKPSYSATIAASWPGWVCVGGAWFMTIAQLQTQWNLNPQYAYGWLTPPLAFFLLWRETEQKPSQGLSSQQGPVFQAICLFCLLLFFPLWLVRGSNPEWRLLNWMMFLPSVVLTLAWFLGSGGLPSLKRVVFPIFFVATSIPLLLSWDLRAATFLQAKVSHFVQETLLLAGRSADIEGNLIRLSNCTVGVDQACSGIRGLQSSIVVSLFLGQFLRLRIPVRLVLVATSVLFAFIMNLFRASLLAHISASKGSDLASKWHDPIGIAESLGTLFLLCLLIFLLVRFAKIPHTFNINDTTHGSFNFVLRPFPKGLGIFAAIWFPLCLLCSAFWYGSNEKAIPDSPKVLVDFHSHTRKFEKQNISEAIRSQLNYSEALSANWISDKGLRFLGFYCRWEQGSGSPLALAVHTPEVCLQLRGYRLIQKYQEVPIRFPFLEAPVPFEAYTFSYQSETIHIFRCYWPDKLLDGRFPGFPSQGYNTTGRIKATIKGYRNPGATMVAIGIFEDGLVRNFELATEATGQELLRRIVPKEKK